MNSTLDAKGRPEAARRFWRQRANRAAMALGLALTCFMLPLRAADDTAGRCSTATLKGDYGLAASGTRAAPTADGQEVFILTGVRTYDGNGSFTTISDDHGSALGPRAGITATGTYTVKPNCSGVATITITTPIGKIELVSSFIIVNKGKTVKEANMDASVGLATAILTKM